MNGNVTRRVFEIPRLLYNGAARVLLPGLIGACMLPFPGLAADEASIPPTNVAASGTSVADATLEKIEQLQLQLNQLRAELAASQAKKTAAVPAVVATPPQSLVTTDGHGPRMVMPDLHPKPPAPAQPGQMDPSKSDETKDLRASAALPPVDPPAPPAAGQQAPGAPPAAPPGPPPVNTADPFAFADFTWMNAVPRNHDSVFDGKYFTGEFRWDSNYIYDYNHPIDHSLGGTTEGTRTGEFVLQNMNVGGDFHWEGVQARFLTQLGAVATATPRNDASNTMGQWDTLNAYRYFTEGYGGYHINVQHGLNIQAGIFMSYIGLFSYYSFDNWAYQPSYVSSNTPWFFNGMRVQWFPTNKLKFEPWLINGWQSYAKYNGRMGVGGQILWRPTSRWDFVFNTYAVGQDTPYTHRTRYHEDDSVEFKEYENPNKLMHRAAMSFTFDVGCERGGGGAPIVAGTTQGGKVVCGHGNANAPAQNFVGGMAYQRFWFDHDKFGATVGGGWVNNPGRYLVLLPPINGATASTGSPYFSANPGDSFKAYDWQATFDWMPTQFVTWRVEFTQRGANVPYFSGPGGLTPPGGNNGMPGATIDGWGPDLRKHENRWTFALLVRL